jgi:hypothetical protein
MVLVWRNQLERTVTANGTVNLSTNGTLLQATLRLMAAG